MAGLDDQSNTAPPTAAGEGGALRAGSGAAPPRRRGRPVLRFVIIYSVMMAAFTTMFYVDFSRGSAFESYLSANARVAVWILEVFDYPARCRGTVISGKGVGPLDIKIGCDAILPTGFFVFGVVAFPVLWRTKLPAVAIGIVGLLSLNVVRILSLYLIKLYYPPAFSVMHLDVWQAVFVIVPMIAWMIWASWARTLTLQVHHVADTQAA